MLFVFFFFFPQILIYASFFILLHNYGISHDLGKTLSCLLHFLCYKSTQNYTGAQGLLTPFAHMY